MPEKWSHWIRLTGTFCRGYITYLLTEYHPKGKDISNYTLHNYYRALNGALNSAVRKKKMKANPFNELEKSEKIRKPESMRSYMTIEEVQALIDTPMPHEEYGDCKMRISVLLLFAGLRISDIIKLKWNDVFVDRGQVPFGRVHEKDQRAYLPAPLSPEALKWMCRNVGAKSSEDNVFDLAVRQYNQNAAQTLGESSRNLQAVLLPHQSPYVCHHDADAPERTYMLSRSCSAMPM